MRALRLLGTQLVQDDSLPIPEVGTEEALVRVSWAGICATDLELVKGYYGYQGVLGHEFVGRVERSPDPKWLGRRVVSSINFADPMTPEYAEFGLEHHPQRTVLGILGHDGAMADYVRLPLANLYEVPDEVDDREAVFAEPLAAALRISQQVTVDPSCRVAVVGPGRLGMLIAKVLSLVGSRVTVWGRSAGSLELPAQWGLETGLVKSAPANAFELVVDATGNAEGLQTAIQLAKPLGTIVMKSTFEGRQSLDLTKIVVDELRIVGSRCGPFAPALRLLKAGSIEVQSLIDGEYPIEDAIAAMEHAARPGVRKILLDLS